MARLEAEVAGLRRAMRTRGLIEQAKGRLVERHGIDADEAFRRLVRRSQKTNVRLVDVAADVMGAASDSTPEQRRLTLLRASTVQAPAEFVELLAEECLATLGADCVALFAVEADGGQQLLAAHGWPSTVVADWRRVPPGVPIPAAEAARTNHPLWLDESSVARFMLAGPGRRRAVLPLSAGSPGENDHPVIGALEIAWNCGDGFDQSTQDYLLAVAGVATDWLRQAPGLVPERGDGGNHRWVEAVVDAAATPAVVLSPIFDAGGSVSDFRIDHANGDATASWSAQGLSVQGRRLLDTDPALATDGVFSACIRIYQGDGDGMATGHRAVRVGNRLVLSWPANQSDVSPRLDAMEEMGGFGWAEWTDTLEPVVWSAGLYRLLGRSPAQGPARLDRLLAAVVPEDRQVAESMVREVLDGRQEIAAEVRIRAGALTRSIGLVIARQRGHRAVLTLFQDVTEARERNAEIERTSRKLATHQVESAAERAQTQRLRAALFPPAETRMRHGALRIVARHAAPSSIHRFRGDFYEITRLGSDLVIVVGDVFGSGVQAADSMVRLRHASRALTLAGLGPGEILGLLNQELCGDREPPLASLLVARFAGGAELSFAQAGHYSPLLLRGRGGRSLRRPRGDALGLSPDTRYTQAHSTLRPGDLVVLYTDGVLNRQSPSGNPIASFTTELAQRRGGDLAALAEHFTRPTEDEACLVAVEWPSP